MTKKSKSAIILFITMFIGIAVGILGSRLYMDMKIKNFRKTRMGPPLRGMIEEIIQPTENQQDSLKIILGEYHDKINQLSENYREKTRELLDSLQQEISPLLTQEQRKRLLKRREYIKSPLPGPMMERGRFRGPVPPGWPMERPDSMDSMMPPPPPPFELEKN